MRIASLHLQDFKRFKDLKVIDLPRSARLVVITGTNGSGKSVLLEALNVARRRSHWGGGDPEYYNKVDEQGIYSQPHQIEVRFHDPQPGDIRSAIWVRSAHRHESDFRMPGVQRQASVIEDPGLERLIVGDRLVSGNYVRLASSSLELFFDPNNRERTAGDLTDSIAGPLQTALTNVFEGLQLRSLVDPLSDGTFFFDKGSSKRFPFKNLSDGERAAFDLLLDLAVRGKGLIDTVFAIDEPELHLGSRVQARLLDELLKLMTPSSQLWIATHSPGMMKRALELHRVDPTSVAFLDTFGYDFDQSVIMTPVRPSRNFWRRSLEIALDDIAKLVAPRTVVLCEGNEVDGFDSVCYRQIFADTHPDVEFVSVGNSHEVKQDKRGVAAAIQIIAPGTEVLRLVDRDDHSDAEVQILQEKGTRVLSLRHIESYLFDDEVISALYASQNNDAGTTSALAEKQRLLQQSADQHAPDDIKKISRAYRTWLQRDLRMTQTGSTTEEFARQILVPLIRQGTKIYERLKADIFGD